MSRGRCRVCGLSLFDILRCKSQIRDLRHRVDTRLDRLVTETDFIAADVSALSSLTTEQIDAIAMLEGLTGGEIAGLLRCARDPAAVLRVSNEAL